MSDVEAAPVTRLVLIDEQTMVRQGLRALVEQEPDFQVVAEAPNAAEASCPDVEPHVVVTDLGWAAGSPEQGVKEVRTRFGNAAIIALTTLDDLPTVRLVIAAGADGYLLKSATKTDLFAGIRAVARGELYLQPSIGIAFAARAPEAPNATVGGLTPRETEVLHFLALGHTNIEIAQIVGASLRTIETHRAHIHRKLDRRTRAELVRFALDEGLLRLDQETARS